jgi:hypothetical protein
VKKRQGRRGPHTVSGDRIELLCHTVNRVANEMSWFHTGPQEFHWAIEEALKVSGLPESWIKAASTPEMTTEYQKSFKVNGYCLHPEQLSTTLRSVLESLE